MKASNMLILVNMLSKILSDVDDLKAMIKEQQFYSFEENYEGEEE